MSSDDRLRVFLTERRARQAIVAEQNGGPTASLMLGRCAAAWAAAQRGTAPSTWPFAGVTAVLPLKLADGAMTWLADGHRADATDSLAGGPPW